MNPARTPYGVEKIGREVWRVIGPDCDLPLFSEAMADLLAFKLNEAYNNGWDAAQGKA